MRSARVFPRAGPTSHKPLQDRDSHKRGFAPAASRPPKGPDPERPEGTRERRRGAGKGERGDVG
jgi:hypothetical protein